MCSGLTSTYQNSPEIEPSETGINEAAGTRSQVTRPYWDLEAGWNLKGMPATMTTASLAAKSPYIDVIVHMTNQGTSGILLSYIVSLGATEFTCTLNEGVYVYMSQATRITFTIITDLADLTVNSLTTENDLTVGGDIIGSTGRTTNFLIAAENAHLTIINQADYLCDGENDQIEINSALENGSHVTLSEGTFNTSAPIRPDEGDTLIGFGADTIIKPNGAQKLPLLDNGISGNFYVNTTNVSNLSVGMGVYINDDTEVAVSYHLTQITRIVNDTVYFDIRALTRDVNTADNAYIINAFYTIICRGYTALPGYNQNASTTFSNITIQDLTIDGNWDNINIDAKHIIPLIGLNSNNSKVINCWLIDSAGDGVIIGGNYGEVINSVIENSRGVGLHPGSYAKGIRLIRNTILNHDSYGIYYCVGVTGSVISENIIRYNNFGVGGLGTKDYYNILSDNDISFNDWRGITNTGPRAFSNFIITNNVIMNNGQAGPGTSYQVHLYGAIDKLIFTNNIIGDDQVSPTAFGGLRFNAGTVVTNSIIEGNIFFGHTDDVYGDLSAPMMFENRVDYFGDVLAAENSSVGSWVGTGSQQLITTGFTGPDVPRTITLTCTNIASPSGVVQIDGISNEGIMLAEGLTISPGGVVESNKAYAIITRIVFPATVTGAEVIDVGMGGKLGLSFNIEEADDVIKCKKNNTDYSDQSTNITVDVDYNTVDVTIGGAIIADTDYTIYFRRNLNLLLS